MPKSLDPNSRRVFVLASDKDKPEATRPRLFGRTLTLNSTRNLTSTLSELKASGFGPGTIDRLIDAGMECLTGWENMIDPATGDSIPFSRDAVGNVLDLEELMEIVHVSCTSGRLSADDRKKSESPH